MYRVVVPADALHAGDGASNNVTYFPAILTRRSLLAYIVHAYMIKRALAVIELKSSLIQTFFPISGVLAVLESYLIEIESSLMQLQSAANELVRFLNTHK